MCSGLKCFNDWTTWRLRNSFSCLWTESRSEGLSVKSLKEKAKSCNCNSKVADANPRTAKHARTKTSLIQANTYGGPAVMLAFIVAMWRPQHGHWGEVLRLWLSTSNCFSIWYVCFQHKQEILATDFQTPQTNAYNMYSTVSINWIISTWTWTCIWHLLCWQRLAIRAAEEGLRTEDVFCCDSDKTMNCFLRTSNLLGPDSTAF